MSAIGVIELYSGGDDASGMGEVVGSSGIGFYAVPSSIY